MMECSKSDWKLFRAKITNQQENYMDRLNKEYIELLSGDENASDKFWKLEERIRQDRKHSGVIMQMRKSEMLYDIVILIRDGVINVQDLEDFSEKLKQQVQIILNRQLQGVNVISASFANALIII